MEHNKFEQKKEIVEKHLTGENEENKEKENITINENKGFWEKTKDTLSEGVESMKNIITGKNNKTN